MTNRTLRPSTTALRAGYGAGVRGGFVRHRAPRFRADSNHSAQRLAEPRRVTDIFLLENSATPTRRRRASVSETLRALAFQRPRLLPLLHSYFFRGGGLNWNGVAKRRGGLELLLYYTVNLTYNTKYQNA